LNMIDAGNIITIKNVSNILLKILINYTNIQLFSETTKFKLLPFYHQTFVTSNNP
jgi:hypothetical protein